MNYKKITSCLILVLSVMGTVIMTSCNSDDSSFKYVNPVNLAVTSFSLTADSKNPGLDSVYFTIDLEHGVIFNADSLRKGIAINKVIPKISFNSNISEATIIMTGGTTREGEVNYRTNPTDSIDFTGDVKLRVKADNDEIGMTYTIKVNVHKLETDTLFWNEVSQSTSPSRLPDPLAMKTVEIDGKIISLVKEADNSYSLIEYESISELRYTVSELSLPFKADIQSLCTTESYLWMLDENGYLWQGESDMSDWSQTGEKWTALLGAYKESVVGIQDADGKKLFTQYPLVNLSEKPVPQNFPVKGYSNFVTLENKWTLSPVAFLAGGIESDGTFSSGTWAFDGTEWIELGNGGIPPLEGASIIPYYHFRPSAKGDSMIEYNVWMLVGGRQKDGSFNRNVYISYDNGVNWSLGTKSMQLPDVIPAMDYCDNIVVDIEKSANLSDSWKSVKISPRKINYWVNGDVIFWDCPYIYLFGGYSPSGKLYTNIWRGVLSRLTFVPVI